MMNEKYINFNQQLPLGEDTGFLSKFKVGGNFLNNTTVLVIILILLFSLIGGFYYYYYVKPSSSSSSAKYYPNREKDPSGTGKTAEVLFFYADWCPHCKTAKPIWNDVKSEYENKTINGYRVVFTEINCSEESGESEQMMNKYNVEGYPTIKLLKDGQVIEYDAKPNKDTLEQFLNTVI